MASTYSNLKIQLMTTGENSTTWGTVTNLNLGTALEEAIVGSADITFASNNQTLTLTDTNASQTARNMRLRCTGTTGGSTRNLVVPSIQKPYIVKNDCADAILVKTAAGAGVTVAAGTSTWVYSDGANVVDVVTGLSLSAPLAITQGGTGTNATTYCNLQTNVAGVLPIVRGGTGTNATTFCNVQVNVVGVLPLANGGVGSNTQSGARTVLGATTVGDALFTAANASAARTTVDAQQTLTSGTNIKTVNGTSLLGSGNIDTTTNNIPAGTKMLFIQTAAPTGWTKDTTHNDKALRVVSGTASSGGSVAFTSAFASQAVAGTVGDTALTEAQLPSHYHFIVSNTTDGSTTLSSANSASKRIDTGGSFSYDMYSASASPTIGRSSTSGTGATHTHTFTGTAINLAVQYVDTIICTKN